MKTLMRPLLFIVYLFLSLQGFGQTITGKIIDKTGNIPYANVTISNAQNKIITGTTTDENGLFAIKVIAGNYIITVSYLGYKDWVKKTSILKDTNLGTILIHEDAESLNEVVVTSKKRLIERKVDRLVFNVEKSIAATGGNGVDVLKIAPGVQAQNGVIEILGKGESQVMINGRILNLQGDDLVNYLTSIAAIDIKSIEVIANPPARYEASGNGGLINIILKKGVANSWKNSTTLTYNQNRYNFSTFQNNFHYRKDKISFSASVNASKGSFENLEGLNIQYPVNFWEIDVNSELKRDELSGRLFIDYDASDKTTIGAQYLGEF